MENKPWIILLIEDNPDHAELVQRSFRKHQLPNQIYHVSDGEAALNYLWQRADAQGAPRPHLILLDLRLPRSMAWKCCERSSPARSYAISRLWFSPPPRPKAI